MIKNIFLNCMLSIACFQATAMMNDKKAFVPWATFEKTKISSGVDKSLLFQGRNETTGFVARDKDALKSLLLVKVVYGFFLEACLAVKLYKTGNSLVLLAMPLFVLPCAAFVKQGSEYLQVIEKHIKEE